MSALESPLEALAFNYLSFGVFTIVNNIWTWVAVITAALSFWRIKTSSTILPKPAPRRELSGDASPSPPKPILVPSLSSYEKVPHVSVDDEPTLIFKEPLKPASAPTTSLSHNLLDKESGTKGRLMMCFEHNDVLGPCDDDCSDTNTVRDGSKILYWMQNAIHPTMNNGVEEWYESWEKVISTKNGEMGWYKYQDLMVIDGNVVRLWDGCRGRRKVEATTFLGGVVRTW